MSETLTITAPLWRWSGGSAGGGWFFVTIDGEPAETIHAHAAMRRLEAGRKKGFGQVRVDARIGQTGWTTSLFPDKAREGFLLPVKAAIRKTEGLGEDDIVTVAIALP